MGFRLQCGRGPKPTEIDALHGRLKGMDQLQCGRGPKPTEIDRPDATSDSNRKLQCGRGPKPTEISRYRTIWYRAQKLQCGRGPKPTEMHAVDMLRDKMLRASMWPRAEAHGNPRGATHTPSPERGLQCGRGPKPTEIMVSPLISPARATLQCGRGPKPTEMDNQEPRPPGQPGASMWPRAEAHGNNPLSNCRLSTKGLQCGRGPKPTEMSRESVESRESRELQCGRGPKPTEILPYGTVQWGIFTI